MLWYAAAALILLVSWLFQLSLLSYAMYALIAIMVISRFLARSWTNNVVARRECNREECEVGTTVAVVVTVENRGAIEDAGEIVVRCVKLQRRLHREQPLFERENALARDYRRLAAAGRRRAPRAAVAAAGAAIRRDERRLARRLAVL